MAATFSASNKLTRERFAPHLPFSGSAAVLMLHYKQSEESARSCDLRMDQVIFQRLADPICGFV